MISFCTWINLKLCQVEEKHKKTKLGVLRGTIRITAPPAQVSRRLRFLLGVEQLLSHLFYQKIV